MKFKRLLADFLFPGVLGSAAAALSIGSSVAGLLGSGQESPDIYAPTGMPQADQRLQQLLQSYTGQAQGLQDTVNPLLQQSLQQGLGVNWSPYLNASQQAGSEYGNLASLLGSFGTQAQRAGQGALGQQQNLYNAGQQLYQLGMDPQQALYNHMLQQTQNQANAVNSQYGLGSSGAGAQIANDTLNKFNMDWQNQQLARAQQGVSGLEGAVGTGSQQAQYGTGLLGESAGFYGQQPGATQQAAATPLQAQQLAAAYPGQLASTYSGQTQANLNPLLQGSQANLGYLGYGTGAQGAAFGAQNTANQFNAGQQQGAMTGLTTGLNALSGTQLGNWLNSAAPGALSAAEQAYTSPYTGQGGSAFSWGA